MSGRQHSRRPQPSSSIALFAISALVIGAGWFAYTLMPEGGRWPGAGAPSATPAATATAEASTPPVADATATPPAAEPTASVAPAPATSPTFTVAAIGDLLFDLGPRQLIAAKGGKAPLAKVASLLRAADLTIANLETTLSNRGTAVTGKPANLIFNGDPRGIASITSSGIDLVSLANNHAMDHGRPALIDTLAALDKAGVGHAGAGLDSKAAWKPALITVKGHTIAYVTATQILPAHFASGTDRAGVAVGRPISRAVAAVRAAKKKAEFVIVSIHWGIEQSYTPNAGQKRDARALIDAGADVVLSHHPHVMQGIDTYKGKLIAYSLGNFLFPYKTVEGRKSIILRFTLGPKGATNITAVPVYLGQWGRPVPQTGASARSILGKLASSSKPMGTSITIKGDIGYIKP